jgi:hypothetical protein
MAIVMCPMRLLLLLYLISWLLLLIVVPGITPNSQSIYAVTVEVIIG